MTLKLEAALIDAYHTGRKVHYTADLDPGSMDGAYEVQAGVAGALGTTVAGWKCGVQDGGKIVFGAPILSLNARESGSTWTLAPGASVKIEVEIAVRLGRDLPPRPGKPYSRDEVLDAVSEVFAGIELVASRYADIAPVSLAAKVADNFNQGGYVTSRGNASFRSLDLSKLRSRLSIDGESRHDTVGGHQQGDPLVPVVAWASAQADRLGGLKAGQFVTTGTLNKPPAIDRPAKIEIEIEGLGKASIELVR